MLLQLTKLDFQSEPPTCLKQEDEISIYKYTIVGARSHSHSELEQIPEHHNLMPLWTSEEEERHNMNLDITLGETQQVNEIVQSTNKDEQVIKIEDGQSRCAGTEQVYSLSPTTFKSLPTILVNNMIIDHETTACQTDVSELNLAPDFMIDGLQLSNSDTEPISGSTDQNIIHLDEYGGQDRLKSTSDYFHGNCKVATAPILASEEADIQIEMLCSANNYSGYVQDFKLAPFDLKIGSQ